MSNKIVLTGFKEFENKLDNLPKVLVNEINGEVKEAAEHWAFLAKQDAPVDVGFLVGGIGTKFNTKNENGALLGVSWSVESNSEYSAPMEWGTKRRARVPAELQSYANQFRGKGGDGQGFYDEILAWVKRKGIGALTTKSGNISKRLDSTIAQEQAAFAIYLSIIRHGVRPHPFFFIQQRHFTKMHGML